MDHTDHYLWILAEECAEVAQRASKAARFGLTEVQTGQTLNNAQRIMVEYADLVAAMDRLIEMGAVSWPSNWGEMLDNKKAKISRFLELSKSQGRLDAS